MLWNCGLGTCVLAMMMQICIIMANACRRKRGGKNKHAQLVSAPPLEGARALHQLSCVGVAAASIMVRVEARHDQVWGVETMGARLTLPPFKRAQKVIWARASKKRFINALCNLLLSYRADPLKTKRF